MAEAVAGWLVTAAGVYGAAGLAFALFFVTVGLARVDRTAGAGTVGFRILIFPGVVAFWPLLAWRWLAGRGTPPEETNPHRQAAGRPKTAEDPR